MAPVALSLALHGAALAGLAVFESGPRPTPRPIVAVEIVGALPTPGEPRPHDGSLHETAPHKDAQPQPPTTREKDHAANRDAPVSVARMEAAHPTASRTEAPPAPSEPPTLIPPRKPAPPAPVVARRAAGAQARGEPARRPDPAPATAEGTVRSVPVETKPIAAPARAVAEDAPAPSGREAAPAGILRARLATTGDGGREKEIAAGARRADNAATSPTYVGLGLGNPKPHYPYGARRRGEQGQVILRVRVSPEGAVEALWVHRGSGHAQLDAEAVRTVRRWRFVPARRRGTAVAGMVDVPITFRLDR